MHVVATIPERHMRSHTILKVRLLFEGGGAFTQDLMECMLVTSST